MIFSQVKPNFKTIILHFPVDRTIMSGYDEVQKLKCSRFLACYELKRLFCLERSLIKCQSLFSIRKSRQIHDMSNHIFKTIYVLWFDIKLSCIISNVHLVILCKIVRYPFWIELENCHILIFVFKTLWPLNIFENK